MCILTPVVASNGHVRVNGELYEVARGSARILGGSGDEVTLQVIEGDQRRLCWGPAAQVRALFPPNTTVGEFAFLVKDGRLTAIGCYTDIRRRVSLSR